MADFDDDVEKTAVLGVEDIAVLRQDIDKQRAAYLIVINGRSVGKMYKVQNDRTFIGRAPDCDVLVDDEGVSRRHAYIQRGVEAYEVVDNNSTNGIFINGQRVRGHALKDGDRLQVGSSTILKFSFQDEMEQNYQKQLYDSATRDALTGAYNKKYFADQLKTEFAYCFRHDTHLSLCLFDIDFFKKLNDGWGHLAGDMVLKELAQVVMKTLRTEDIFARYGGEEFGVILRDTDGEHAFLIAERLRRKIEAYKFMYEGERLPVTVSIGVSTLEQKNHESPKAMVKAADGYLYKAKEAGRNRTECALMAS
jgi:two-component system cell cycle response regulator